MSERQTIAAFIVVGVVFLIGLIWARMEIKKRHSNIRAFIWYRLMAWCGANGDAAKLREHRAAIYTAVANSRADSEEPLEIWGGGRITSIKQEEDFEAWKRRSLEEDRCPI